MDATVPEMVSGVPATMLITVSARALAQAEKPEMQFRDPFAEALVADLGIDPHEYCTFVGSLVMTIYRSVFLDRISRDFYERHPDGVVMNLACGLGTNYERVAAALGEDLAWFDIDLPEVIEIRRRYFPDTHRRHAIEGDLTDPALFSRLVSWAESRPTLVLMEGVLYYLDPAQVGAVFVRLGAAHDAAGVACDVGFDVVSPTGLELSNLRNTDSHRTETKMTWACGGAAEVLGWDPHLELVEIGDHGAFLPEEIRPLFAEATDRDGIPPAAVLHLRRAASG